MWKGEGGDEGGVQGLIFRGHFHIYRTTGHVKPYAYRINGILSVRVMDTAIFTYFQYYTVLIYFLQNKDEECCLSACS